jgi:Bacterial membrane protein YfhO
VSHSRPSGPSSLRARLAPRAAIAWWPPLLLLILPALLFHQGLGTGTPPFGGDIVSLNYPLLVFLKRQLAHGLLPLWNNVAGGGYPLVPFSGLVAYPPLWPLHWMDARDAITVLDMAHLAIAGIGAYMLAGVTGASRIGRLVGALAFMLSGFMVGHLYAGHLLEMGVIAWMPWVYFAAHRLLERPDARAALWLGLFAGLQLLANGLGFLVFTIYPVGVLLIIGTIARFRVDARAVRRLLASIAVSGAVALGLAAVIVLPFAQSLGWSIRAGGLDFSGASKISLLPAALLMAFSPDAVGTGPDNTYWLDQFSLHYGYWHEFALYVGLLPLLAVAATCLYCRSAPHARFYAYLAAFGLVLAFGKYTPIYGLFFHLPGLSLVRVPARWLLVCMLGVAVLAGPGVDWLLARRSGARDLWRALRVPLIGAAALIAVLVAGLQAEYMRQGHIDVQPKIIDTVLPAGGRLLLFGGFLALLLCCHAERLIRPPATTALLLAFTLLDLWVADSGSILFVDPSSFYQPTTVSTLLHPDAATYRVLAINDRAMPYRQGMVSGDIYDAEDFAPVTLRPYYTVTHPQSLDRHFQISNADARDLITCYDQRYATLLGIGEVVTAAPFSSQRLCLPGTGEPQLTLRTAVLTERWILPNGTSWNPTWFQGIAYIYRNTAALPRAFLLPASSAVPMSLASAQLHAVLAPGFDGARQLLYSPEVRSAPLGLGFLQRFWATLLRPRALAVPADLALGQARVLSDTGNSVQVAVNASAPSYLVLDDTYYPGWQLWIDGKPAAIHQADYVLRAAAVPAGRHVLVFTYAPLSFLAGFLLTTGTAVLVAAGLAWPLARRVRGAAGVSARGSAVVPAPSFSDTAVSAAPTGSAAS